MTAPADPLTRPTGTHPVGGTARWAPPPLSPLPAELVDSANPRPSLEGSYCVGLGYRGKITIRLSRADRPLSAARGDDQMRASVRPSRRHPADGVRSGGSPRRTIA